MISSRFASSLFWAILVFCFLTGFVIGAEKKGEKDAKKEKDKGKTEVLTPGFATDVEEVELKGDWFVTSDGVLLTGMYYPGKGDKECIPVVLLHGQSEDRTIFEPLIAELRKKGCAVLVPDLRGHGASVLKYPDLKAEAMQTQVPIGGFDMSLQAGINMVEGMNLPPALRRQALLLAEQYSVQQQLQIQQERMLKESMTGERVLPEPVEYSYEKFTSDDYLKMLYFDWVPFNEFLVYENNLGKLNAKKLVIVGIDMGGTLGAVWANTDWSKGKPRNCKALLILSPNDDSVVEEIFKDNKVFRENVSLTLILGESNKTALEKAKKVQALVQNLEKRGKNANPNAASIIGYKTETKGGALLGEPEVAKDVAELIEESINQYNQKLLKWKKM
ncbi:MAG: alpha/beta hydrolase [Thermoguttaceae bacterium]